MTSAERLEWLKTRQTGIGGSDVAAILECKTASSFIADQWGPSQEAEIVAGKIVTEHKIPIYYETQVQWYMGVTGAKRCYVAALLGGQDFRIYCVERDDDVIDALQSQCREFWYQNVPAGSLHPGGGAEAFRSG